MNILVTGGAGFIGSHVAERLLSGGHEITILDNLKNGSRENLPSHAHFLEMDLSDPTLGDAVARLRPEVIVHLAAQIDVRASCQDPVFDAEENIIATLRLATAGLANGLKQFVFASSGGAIYGEATGPQSEAHPEVPINPYGVAKLSVDKYLYALHCQHGLLGCSLRFSNVYGPRQGPKGEAGVVAVFCKRLRETAPLVINGDGAQTRDFVFAPDLAEAIHLAVERRAAGIINLGTGRETSVLDLASSLCRIAGVESARMTHGSAVSGEQRRSVLDPAKAKEILGWSAGTGLESGLKITYDWFQAHRPQAS